MEASNCPLEGRVSVLERDFALLRAETRGWAEMTLSAHRKLDVSVDLLTLIYRDMGEIKGQLGGHSDTLDRHTEILDRHTGTLDKHTETLDRHTGTLDMHTEMLSEILARLPKQP